MLAVGIRLKKCPFKGPSILFKMAERTARHLIVFDAISFCSDGYSSSVSLAKVLVKQMPTFSRFSTCRTLQTKKKFIMGYNPFFFFSKYCNI